MSHSPSLQEHSDTSGRQRVIVFIDGQNLYKSVWYRHRTRIHPILLGRELAGDRDLVECRYYSGMHAPRENPAIHALASRRHRLMRDTGVTVVERQLRYHWDWVISDRLPRADQADEGSTREVTAERRRVAREKGIDLALGLDAATAAAQGSCDAIVIVSRDHDLVEVASELTERAASEGRPRRVAVEVAIVGHRGSDHPGYDRTHAIGAAMVDRCRDDFDYSKKLGRGPVREFLATLVSGS